MISAKCSKRRYAYTRSLVYGVNGMAATSQPLAAQAGIDVLKAGGNAVDAAIAMAATMTVVEPCSNGLGGDCFALVWMNGELKGMNSSGKSPALTDANKYYKRGIKSIPMYGVDPITVPGVVRGWKKLHDEFGQMKFERVFDDAIRLASEGFAVTPVIAKIWEKEVELHTRENINKPEFQPFFDTFTLNGRAPKAGEIWKCPEQAETLTKLAKSGGEAMYTGELADRIDEFLKMHGGALRKSDLESHRAEMVEPVGIEYRGYNIWELPPNGQGITALMALNILKEMDLSMKESVDTVHKQMEAMKLAYTDARAYISDPDTMKIQVSELLSSQYASERRNLISEKAMVPEPGHPDAGGTIYLCCADKWGNMVSLIQSNYKNFGSGIVIPHTGIAMHNRGIGFNLNPQSPNCLAPNKRPYHTIIPGFITKDAKAVGTFGVMGGYMQPQGHVQVIMNMLDFGLNPQEALDAPRWQWMEGLRFEFEDNLLPDKIQELTERGHQIYVNPDSINFGRGQIIIRNENGVYMGATEPRADGACLGF